MFTVELGKGPRELELFTIGEIVDHLEYILSRKGGDGDQA